MNNRVPVFCIRTSPIYFICRINFNTKNLITNKSCTHLKFLCNIFLQEGWCKTKFPNGKIISELVLTALWKTPQVKQLCNDLGIAHKYRTIKEYEKIGAKPLDGYMLRYIYFIDKSYKDKLTCPILPYSKIQEFGAGMYKGKKK